MEWWLKVQEKILSPTQMLVGHCRCDSFSCWWAERNLFTLPKLNCLGNGLADTIEMRTVWNVTILSYRKHLMLLGKSLVLLPKFVSNNWCGWSSNNICDEYSGKTAWKITEIQKRLWTVVMRSVWLRLNGWNRVPKGTSGKVAVWACKGICMLGMMVFRKKPLLSKSCSGFSQIACSCCLLVTLCHQLSDQRRVGEKLVERICFVRASYWY